MSKWKLLPLVGVCVLMSSCAQVLESMVDSALSTDRDDAAISAGTRHYKTGGYDINTSYQKARQDQFENNFFSGAGQ